jgi:hypothetical protein
MKIVAFVKTWALTEVLAQNLPVSPVLRILSHSTWALSRRGHVNVLVPIISVLLGKKTM